MAVTVALTLLTSIGMEMSQGCSEANTLTVRNGHAMVYDSKHRLVLLFGGADDRQVLGDLWAWDGDVWRCMSDGGPPPRTFPGLAFDKARKQLVLFGGNRVLFGSGEGSETFLNDTWIWDGQDWAEFQGRTPASRAEPGMVYDSHRNRIVLFGGHRTVNGERQRFDDTWEWDGKEWKLRTTDGPSGRNGVAMAFDSYRNRVVIFGGSGGPTGDTWEWDGQRWERILSAATQGRFNSDMAFDETSGKVIRFGGWTGTDRLGDTWQYNGREWQKVSEDGPAGRNHAAMVYDGNRDVFVLFGGHDGRRVFGDTWELHSNYEWNVKIDSAPRLRIENGH